MTFVVTENCIKCKYTDCVEECPVGAFHEGSNMVVINPEVCIECGICATVCPIQAIKADEELETEEEQFLEINAELSREWPEITVSKEPMEDAEEWIDVENKLAMLDR
ncbi:MAG: DUF3470 domain-containing protein [Proteobacteria bacterium]|nr:DUF3470 domain-containing protein [Pseudomonadota bacterium]